MNKALTIIALTLLAGCATKHEVVAVCPPVVEYSLDFQQALADELEKLRADNPLVKVITDYYVLRQGLKKC